MNKGFEDLKRPHVRWHEWYLFDCFAKNVVEPISFNLKFGDFERVEEAVVDKICSSEQLSFGQQSLLCTWNILKLYTAAVWYLQSIPF